MKAVNRLRQGYMTIFASICFALIMSLVTVCIESARLQGSRAYLYMINDLSLDTLMSYYSLPLFNEYQLLFLDGGFGESTINENRMNQITMDNILTTLEEPSGIYYSYTDFFDVSLSGMNITNTVKACDANGGILEKEITDYMKYVVPAEKLTEFEAREQEIKDAETASEVSEDMEELNEVINTANESVFSFLEKAEGVKTDGCEIVIKNGSVESVNEFAKKLIYDEVSMSAVGIYNEDIYNGVKEQFISLKEPLEEIKSKINELETSQDPAIIYNQYDTDINTIVNEYIVYIEAAVTNTESALTALEEVKNSVAAVDSKRSELKNSVSNSSEVSDETKEILNGSLDEMESEDESGVNGLFNIENVESALNHNLAVYEQLKLLTDLSGEETTAENIEEKLSVIDLCIQSASTLKISQIQFDYTNFSVDGQSEQGNVLDDIRNFLDNGVLSLVVDDVSTISESSTSVSQNSVSDSTVDVELPEELYGKYLTVEYIFSYFDNYLEDKDESTLSYEVEYILCGEDSDKENLTETVLKIAAFREGFNLIYLMSEPDKKAEALALANAIVGFTGMYPLIKVTQYAILALWAYAEGIADAKTLLAGEKVPLMKKDETWNLSYENLINKQINVKGGNDKGYTYEEYLRFMFYLMDKKEVLARIMDMIDDKMHYLGYGAFTMKNCIYSVEIQTDYSLMNKYSCEISGRKSY